MQSSKKDNRQPINKALTQAEAKNGRQMCCIIYNIPSDSVILTGRHSLLSFETLVDLQKRE